MACRWDCSLWLCQIWIRVSLSVQNLLTSFASQGEMLLSAFKKVISIPLGTVAKKPWSFLPRALERAERAFRMSSWLSTLRDQCVSSEFGTYFFSASRLRT